MVETWAAGMVARWAALTVCVMAASKAEKSVDEKADELAAVKAVWWVAVTVALLVSWQVGRWGWQ